MDMYCNPVECPLYKFYLNILFFLSRLVSSIRLTKRDINLNNNTKFPNHDWLTITFWLMIWSLCMVLDDHTRAHKCACNIAPDKNVIAFIINKHLNNHADWAIAQYFFFVSHLTKKSRRRTQPTNESIWNGMLSVRESLFFPPNKFLFYFLFCFIFFKAIYCLQQDFPPIRSNQVKLQWLVQHLAKLYFVKQFFSFVCFQNNTKIASLVGHTNVNSR